MPLRSSARRHDRLLLRGRVGPHPGARLGPPWQAGAGPDDLLSTRPRGGSEENPVRDRLAKSQPYGEWVEQYLKPAPLGEPKPEIPEDLVRRQVGRSGTRTRSFTTVIRPMAMTGHEPTSSMGDDTAPGGLGRPRPSPLQLFQAAFRPGDQPAVDPASGAAGDEHPHADRPSRPCPLGAAGGRLAARARDVPPLQGSRRLPPRRHLPGGGGPCQPAQPRSSGWPTRPSTPPASAAASS